VRTDDSYISYRTTAATRGEWFVWDGRVHVLEPRSVDDLLVTSFIDAYENIAEKFFVGDELTKARERIRKWSTSGQIRALKERVREELRVPQDTFDKDRRWLVMRDGYVLDLWMIDDEPLPPDPSRPVTRCLGVCLQDYEEHWSIDKNDEMVMHPDDLTPYRWLTWLDETLPLKEEQLYLQEALGAALLGSGDAKNIVHLVGKKNTGKSTLLNIGVGVFGAKSANGYAGTLPSSALMKTYSGANFAQREAKGVRFLKISEPSTERTDDAFLKNLAGGGEHIVTEQKNRDPEEWLAECVLFIAANSVVKFDVHDKALSERVNILEFNHVIEKVDVDFVPQLLVKEGGLILSWIIEGAKRYQYQGHIVVPQSIKDRAISHVVASSGPLRWLEEMVETGRYTIDLNRPRSHYVNRANAYSEYVNWCVALKEKEASQSDWQAEIHSMHDAPSDALKKSNGTKRLFGVLGTNTGTSGHLDRHSEVRS
jgi:hypothetical protein